MGCLTVEQCVNAGLDATLQGICQEIVKVCKDQEDIQTQIYIVSGAVGGVLLILIILVIALFVKLSMSSKRADGLYGPTGDELAKRGFSTYTGPHVIPEAPKPIIATPPAPAPYLPAFDPSRSSNAINSSGGVRVLPRNPPPSRNNNQASYNEGYY